MATLTNFRSVSELNSNDDNLHKQSINLQVNGQQLITNDATTNNTKQQINLNVIQPNTNSDAKALNNLAQNLINQNSDDFASKLSAVGNATSYTISDPKSQHENNNDLSGRKNKRKNKSQQKQQIPNLLEPSNEKLHLQQQQQQQQQQHKEHFQIRWTNLTYQVEAKWYRQNVSSLLRGGVDSSSSSKKTKILQNLNGCVKSGQVTAILGPSGAGKTSLLGCLTGKHKSGVSGCVQVISERAEPMSICTIPQKDYLLNQLTVRENLWFASRLKHPEDHFDHDSNIERVLELLKLESCIDTQISKISGGQHKRVSIAQELLSNPDILILDEPTSGLDSLTCYKTVMVLRDLARLSPNPMAILVTIHQPQREVFDLFNHVYILATGGRCIYEGNPLKSIETINEFGGGLQFDAHQYNPASYLVEIASVEFGEKPIESLMEHQQRDFKRLICEEDQANATGCYYDESTGKLLSATPNLRKRQSPMVARFKSTLNNLRGKKQFDSGNISLSSATGNMSPITMQRKPTQQAHSDLTGSQAAFANEAFEHHQSQINLSSSDTDHQSNQQVSHNQNTDTIILEKRPNLDQMVITPTDNNNDISNTTLDNDNKQKLASLTEYSGPFEERLVITQTSSNGEPIEEGEFYLDDRLQTHKHNHKGHFLRHCRLLTKRSWLCLCKDPMLTTLRFSAHIIVPLLITLVYGNRVGKPNACPIYETEMDLIDYARNGPKRLMQLQKELRCSFENVGLYFLSIYAFTFSTMCLTSLSFPLNMHVLLKEVRNGWYSLPTYFIGKTLADFPLEFILPVVTLIITYPLTGQPDSYWEWRFIAATSVFVITSLIAQTQGLIFGALFMNAMQAAVFVAPVSTTPLILLSGFLIRISQMPSYLQTLSCFSYFRYAIESLTIIRYGFDMCPCDPQLVNGKPVSAAGVPDQLRTMTNYWLSTFDDQAGNDLNDTELAATTTLIPSTADNGQPVDFFQDLTVLLARANSFGTEIKTCEELKPYPMIDFNLTDDMLSTWAIALVATLIGSKIVNYMVVKYSVKWRL